MHPQVAERAEVRNGSLGSKVAGFGFSKRAAQLIAMDIIEVAQPLAYISHLQATP